MNPQELVKKGTAHIQKAIQLDTACNYAEAKAEYVTGVGYFLSYVKYEKNDAAAKPVRTSIQQYLARAETLKKLLESGTQKSETAASTMTIDSFRVGNEGVRFDDIAGLENAKRLLRESVLFPLEMPHIFTADGPIKPWSGVLLFGPPGTGKTFLAKAVASEARCTFLSLSAADIFSKWQGESEQNIRELFKAARSVSDACIIFIDEIDSFTTARDGGGAASSGDSARRVLTQFLKEFDGIQPKKDNTKQARVIVIGATNTPWALDPGVVRRFARRIYISLPDANSRLRMITSELNKARNTAGYRLEGIEQSHINELVQKTEGYSAADIATLLQDSFMSLISKLTDAQFFYKTPENRLIPCTESQPGAFQTTYRQVQQQDMLSLPPLTPYDLKLALLNTKPSVDPTTLSRYEEFATERGQMG